MKQYEFTCPCCENILSINEEELKSHLFSKGEIISRNDLAEILEKLKLEFG